MRIIALFNLKPGIAREDYEDWARTRDLPGVRSLVSVNDFNVYRSTGVLFSEDRPPYDYIEILDVDDLDNFMKDVSGDVVQQLAPEMSRFTETAVFIKTDPLSVA